MNKERQAVILAGGFGTRLSHIVSDVPKPMAPVNNVPFLDYVIKRLKQQNFTSFVFLTGYKAEVIENYFKNLENAVFVKEEKALGTGGAVLNAYNKLSDEFFVLNGDDFFDIDYSILEDFGQDKPVSIALRYTEDISRYGSVKIDNNYRAESFIEKGAMSPDKIDGFINGGIYFMHKSALKKYADGFNGENISIETKIFPDMCSRGCLYALPSGGYFIDIGVPEDYFTAQKTIPEWLNKPCKPALFIDKDGTLIENTGYPSGRNFKIIEKTIDIVKHYAEKEFYIVMAANQAGIAKGKFTITQMLEGIEGIKEFYAGKGVKFDDIEYCPYHKDGIIKEYSYDTILRKPEPGMILKACEKLRIDLKNSVMLGDNLEIDNIKLPYLKCIITDSSQAVKNEY